jgi:hypothetical protein
LPFLEPKYHQKKPDQNWIFKFYFSAILLAYSAKDSSALGISHSKDALQNQLLKLYSFKIAVLAGPGIK